MSTQQSNDTIQFSSVENPMDRLELLRIIATRDQANGVASLIDTLLTIIDGLHTRICTLDDKVATLEAIQ